MQKDSVRRFSRRAENYDKFRPSYPLELIDYLAQRMALHADGVVADMAAGTGIFTELIAPWGNKIYVVEPNVDMRAMALKRLSFCNSCVFVDGTAEESGLPAQSVDLLVSAQAFHWFDLLKTKAEFVRICREGAYIAVIWNLRNTDTAFEQGYESLIRHYATDYLNVSQRKMEAADVLSFFAPNIPDYKVFEYADALSIEQLCGRTLSYSYMPDEESTILSEVFASLTQLFDAHQQNGKVRLSYKTKLFIGHLT